VQLLPGVGEKKVLAQTIYWLQSCDKLCFSWLSLRSTQISSHCFRHMQTATETHELLAVVNGNESESCMCFFRLFRRLLGSESPDESRSELLSTAWGLETVKRICELVAGDHWMTLNLMASQLHMNWEMGCLILYEILGRSFFYTTSQISSSSTESGLANTTSRPVIQIHTLPVAWLLETCLGCFHRILKQSNKYWSWVQYHYPNTESHAGMSQGSKPCF